MKIERIINTFGSEEEEEGEEGMVTLKEEGEIEEPSPFDTVYRYLFKSHY